MEEIYSTPFKKKGNPNEFGTAAHWLAEQRQLLRDGFTIDPRARKWTVAEWCQDWHDSPTRVLADNSVRVYQSMIDNDLTPTDFGNMLLTDVQDIHVAAWLKDMAYNRHWRTKNLSVSTVNIRRALIRAAFNAAVLKKIRHDNPVQTVKRLRQDLSVIQLDPRDIPTKADIWAWHEYAGKIAPALQEPIIIAAGTGMRPGEIFGMEESQLTRDETGRVTEIYVSRQLKLGSPGTQFGRLKTDNSYRSIPAGMMVADAIDRHLQRYPLQPDRPDGTVILRRDTGEPWTRSTFYQQWVRIRSLGQPTEPGPELEEADPEDAAQWYRFRHFYISGLIEGGASPRLVMERAGHGSPAYTLARYARLWPNADEVAARLSDKALQRDMDGTSGTD